MKKPLTNFVIDVPKNLKTLEKLVLEGEEVSLEFKRTTGELREALQTLCAFLNTEGGKVIFGISPKGLIEGQQVSAQTIHEITASFGRFEPPITAKINQLKVRGDRKVLILSVEANKEAVPFTFDGRAFERIGNTTRKMTQDRYETLLFDRAHVRRRWENQAAVGVKVKDLDRDEILRTRDLAIQQRRISASTSRKIDDILDRLGLRQDGALIQAAHVLFGKNFLPDYPQCMLKMGRFRGADVNGEIVDNRQEHMNAFAIVREAMAFLERTLPLGARFPKGKIFREDRLPVPPDALRELLLNAVMHRDYSDPGGYVAIAVFDDRVEIRSYGRLPTGITLSQLAGTHLSRLRNPLIAETFHRTGAVEVWGRGINRVLSTCKEYGIAPPQFQESQGFLIVTLFIPAAAQPGSARGSQKSSLKSSQKSSQKIVEAIAHDIDVTTSKLAQKIGISERAVKKHVRNLKDQGRLLRIGPDKGGHWELSEP